jgi:carboxypeptidase Taq
MGPIEDLKTHLATVHDVNSAGAVLRWDQETKMPPGGAKVRAEQLGTLSRIAHNLFVSSETERLLAAAETAAGTLDADSDEAALVRVTRRDFDIASKLPVDFVAERARARSLSTEAWREARPRNDFAHFRPALEQMVDYARRTADYLGYADHPYDALLDLYEPNMKTRDVNVLFDRLREGTLPLVKTIAARGQTVDSSFLTLEYSIEEQRAFGVMVAEAFGYDFSRGRLDESPHPFASGFNTGDVRITTRYFPRHLTSAIFGIFHESGHAMYEQGVSKGFERTPLARGASLGIHESQSRMWENLVGRSRPFWEHFYPILRNRFSTRLNRIDLDAFFKAVNMVQLSPIRVEADEMTYNLHIMLRFELEKQLLEGKLAARELPEAWNAKTKEYLGLEPRNDADGVMQDIHWAGGSIGYFPTYTLGNVISVQLFEAARRAHPRLTDEFKQGKFSTLLSWLRDNVHRHGRKFFPRDLIKRATGADLTPEPYLRYLETKFGAIYGIRAGAVAATE